jgi:hypothetical protein
LFVLPRGFCQFIVILVSAAPRAFGRNLLS